VNLYGQWDEDKVDDLVLVNGRSLESTSPASSWSNGVVFKLASAAMDSIPSEQGTLLKEIAKHEKFSAFARIARQKGLGAFLDDPSVYFTVVAPENRLRKRALHSVNKASFSYFNEFLPLALEENGDDFHVFNSLLPGVW